MKLTAAMIEEIRNTIEEMQLEDEYEYIGVRVQEQPFELGEIGHISKMWIDGEETDEDLSGICTTKVDSIAQLPYEYFGEHVAIICGNCAEYGEDVGELIIEDAVVSAIIC